jgi:hypothetical protein
LVYLIRSFAHICPELQSIGNIAMEELVNALNNGFGSLGHLSFLPNPARILELAPVSISLAAIFSGAGSVILGKYTGSVGYLTMPINYCVLFLGALLSNWLFEGVRLPMLDPNMQAPMVFTVAGMTVTALAMMMFVRTEQYR